MLEISVRNESRGTEREGHVKIVRPGAPISEAAAQRQEDVVARHIKAATFADLPEVGAYLAARDQMRAIDNDIERIEIEARQAALDQQRLLAGGTKLSGAKLAEAISEAQDREHAARQRLDADRRGAKTYRSGPLAQAHAAAAAAVLARLRDTVLPAIRAELASADARARGQLAGAATPLLDTLDALQQASEAIGVAYSVEMLAGRADELLGGITLPPK